MIEDKNKKNIFYFLITDSPFYLTLIFSGFLFVFLTFFLTGLINEYRFYNYFDSIVTFYSFNEIIRNGIILSIPSLLLFAVMFFANKKKFLKRTKILLYVYSFFLYSTIFAIFSISRGINAYTAIDPLFDWRFYLFFFSYVTISFVLYMWVFNRYQKYKVELFAFYMAMIIFNTFFYTLTVKKYFVTNKINVEIITHRDFHIKGKLLYSNNLSTYLLTKDGLYPILTIFVKKINILETPLSKKAN